jgi:hypothetical protein
LPVMSSPPGDNMVTRKVGLVPVPPDEELGAFLLNMVTEDSGTLDRHLAELQDTVDVTIEDKDPEVFAYARMLNFLAKNQNMNRLELVHLCAAALWRLNEEQKLPDATLHSIETDTNGDRTQVGTNDADGPS